MTKLFNAFDQALRVELAPSRLLAAAWLSLNGLAAGGLLYLSLPWPVRLGLVGALCLYAWFGYRLHVSLSLPWSVRALAWDRAQGWRVRLRCGDWRRAELCTPVLVSHRIAALHLRLQRFRYARVVIVSDRTADDDFRRLRVHLLQSVRGDRDRKKIPGVR